MDALFDFVALLLWGFCAALAVIFCVYLYRSWRLKRLMHPRRDYYRKVFTRHRSERRRKHRSHRSRRSEEGTPENFGK